MKNMRFPDDDTTTTQPDTTGTGSGDTDGDGYTNIEEWAATLANPDE